MKCPYCGNLGDKVVDSRESKEGEVIRRRRECLECGRRFTSYERIDEIPYMVVKKDGRRERFDRQKLVSGLLKACEKRPVRVPALEAIADKVEGSLQERPEREMSTEDIGALRHAGAQRARQGGVRAVRVGLSQLPRPRRVQARAERVAQDAGMTRRRAWLLAAALAAPHRRSPRPAKSTVTTVVSDGPRAGVVHRAVGLDRRHQGARAERARADVLVRRRTAPAVAMLVRFDARARAVGVVGEVRQPDGHVPVVAGCATAASSSPSRRIRRRRSATG